MAIFGLMPMIYVKSDSPSPSTDGSIWVPDNIREWCLEVMLSDSETAAGESFSKS